MFLHGCEMKSGGMECLPSRLAMCTSRPSALQAAKKSCKIRLRSRIYFLYLSWLSSCGSLSPELSIRVSGILASKTPHAQLLSVNVGGSCRMGSKVVSKETVYFLTPKARDLCFIFFVSLYERLMSVRYGSDR